LLGLANTVPFDDRINQRATLTDLDLGLIRTFLRAIGSDLYRTSAKMDFEALCRQMQIVDGPPEATFPRNVGLLFFNEEPFRFFPQAQIDVVYFPDGAGGDRFEEKIFRGPLDRMLREALAYVQSRYLGERVIKYPDRAEAERFYNFPYEAIEEALANAVYHRGYDVREPIEVRISPTEIVVVNLPRP
jgi:ATP-dependent DNA helicase RecG